VAADVPLFQDITRPFRIRRNDADDSSSHLPAPPPIRLQ